MKVVLCTIIVVITSNLIQKITLNILCSVPCCEVQQIFFFWLSMGRRWVRRTLNFKQVSYESGICTIIVVITSHLIRKITLNMLCSVPCCEVEQFFFLAVQLSQLWNFNSELFNFELQEKVLLGKWWCLNEKVELLLQAGHASPVKWCLKEKVLLGKWPRLSSGVWKKRCC